MDCIKRNCHLVKCFISTTPDCICYRNHRRLDCDVEFISIFERMWVLKVTINKIINNAINVYPLTLETTMKNGRNKNILRYTSIALNKYLKGRNYLHRRLLNAKTKTEKKSIIHKTTSLGNMQKMTQKLIDNLVQYIIYVS